MSDPKPHQVPPHTAPGALLGLQATAGNPAVSALVAAGTGVVQRSTVVQREPRTEQKKEFDGYVNQGDWGRAAWVLNGWSVDDIDDAVRRLDPVARAKGAIRVLAPQKRWDEAAKVLGAVPHRTAMTYVKDLAAKAALTNADLRVLMRTAPNLHLRPGDTRTVDGTEFVVYAHEIRAGGDPAWRNNNPGNLRFWDGADAAWGSIGVATGRFLIFPDRALGFAAVKKNFEFKLGQLKAPTIMAMMENYASVEDGNRPDVYADKIVQALGGTTSRETRWSTLTPAQRETARGVVVHTERENAGDTFSYESPKLPVEVRELLGP